MIAYLAYPKKQDDEELHANIISLIMNSKQQLQHKNK